MRPSDSFIQRFSQRVHGSPKRRVDVELRALDIVLAGFFLLVTLPLLVLIAAALMLTSGLPLFYKGERVGRGGRISGRRNSRTFRRGGEDRLGPSRGTELFERPRAETTRLGRRLRATQLDE